VFMVRRWRLARTQTSLLLLSLLTLAVVILIGVPVALAQQYLGLTPRGILIACTWLWQIPAGFFVGTGLSWSIRDRQIAGVYSVDQRDVEHATELSPIQESHP